MAAFMSPAIAFLFSCPRKAAATFAPPAAARQAQVKSSSDTEARTMPPMTGTSINSLAVETCGSAGGANAHLRAVESEPDGGSERRLRRLDHLSKAEGDGAGGGWARLRIWGRGQSHRGLSDKHGPGGSEARSWSCPCGGEGEDGASVGGRREDANRQQLHDLLEADVGRLARLGQNPAARGLSSVRIVTPGDQGVRVDMHPWQSTKGRSTAHGEPYTTVRHARLAKSRCVQRARAEAKAARELSQRNGVDGTDGHLEPSHDHGELRATARLGGGLVVDVVVVVSRVPSRQVHDEPNVDSHAARGSADGEVVRRGCSATDATPFGNLRSRRPVPVASSTH
eukprot:scaffold20385_cov121-Isochrysis_galbana.AAC.8